MKALVCSEYGDGANTSLGDLRRPEIGEKQVLIEVHSAGIAYVDALMVRNKHQNKHELPFAPGMAVAGVVAQTGGDVSRVAVGDRVMALVYDGGLAEYAVAPEPETFKLLDRIDMATAATLANGYLTPHAALRWDAQLAAGEKVLVLGAAGTVGSAAVEVAAAMGAEVIAAGSTQEKLDLARRHGAAHGVCYSEQDLYETVSEITGKNGTNVVFDPVGGDLYEAAFRTLGWGGRYTIIGFAGGGIPQIPANRLLVKNRKAVGFVLMYYRRYRTDLLADTVNELMQLVLDGKLKAKPGQVVSLADAGRAIDTFFNREAIGNTIVALKA